MTVSFDRSFDKSLDKLGNKQVAGRIVRLIDKLEQTTSLQDVSNVKKLQGYDTYYRVRIGDYRIVLEMIDATHVRFIVLGSSQRHLQQFAKVDA